MSDMPDRELDRRIRDLVADAASDAPEPPDASTFTQVSGRTNGRRDSRWGLFTAIGATAAAAAAVAAFVVIPGLGDEAIREMDPADRPPVTTEPAREPEPTSPPITAPAPTDPAPTDPDIAAPEVPAPAIPPATEPPIEAEPICTGGFDGLDAAVQFAEAVMFARESGEFVAVSDCLDEIPEMYTGEVPACWTECDDIARTMHLGEPSEVTLLEPPYTDATTYWYTRLAVSYRADDGIVDVIESWRLGTDDDTGEHIASDFGIEEPFATREQSHATIAEYFGHIERADWDAVASMLDDGAVNFEERSDYQELDPADFTRDQVIAALEAWCTPGCDTEMPEPDEVTFTGSYGVERGDRTIFAVNVEGRYSIRGLPFPTAED
jgi:hypothetical protein